MALYLKPNKYEKRIRMKRYIISLGLLFVTVCAHAQLFDFSSNKNRYEIGLNLGQMAFNTQYARFGMGMNALAWGVYMDCNMTAAQHKFDRKFSDTQWDDDEFFNINLGYQIPILSWIRVMPLLGYAQTNEGITDASTINIDISHGEESNPVSVYHTYTVTPGSRVHYFNYGGGVSIQPLKWFSINFVYTRYAVYGGLAISL